MAPATRLRDYEGLYLGECAKLGGMAGTTNDLSLEYSIGKRS